MKIKTDEGVRIFISTKPGDDGRLYVNVEHGEAMVVGYITEEQAVEIIDTIDTAFDLGKTKRG